MAIPDQLPCEAILESIADGVFTVDLDWNVTSFNQAATRITGVPHDEALGQKCWEVFHSSLCDGACALKACMKGAPPIGCKSIFIVRPDGEKIPVSISAAALYDAQGNLIGGVETFRDLSEIQRLRREVERSHTFEDIVGKSPALEKIFGILPQVARSNATALILGDSGTGKELFARALHNLSERAKGPFVTVNCGALPETLLESELFGYKAGAFTDAKRDKPGRFHQARGGTIFLDEIGDMPMALQVKLLRVLQDKTYEPLGSIRSETSNARVVAATNHDLATLVAEGRFRQDLFYRLNVVQLNLPSLRERREDLPLLVNHCLRRLNAMQGKDLGGVSEDVMALLMRHDFPGNVRELENILEFAAILCPSGFIQVEHLPEQLQPQGPPARNPAAQDYPMTLDEAKCRAVLAALTRNHGKRMATCRELDISKDTLRRLLARCEESGS
ncbi:MAG: sigma 54-interacting transcriptional regulator [Proteobacteria bacterium]|nr:sigma 54-interacting transcriptional regulator [Pseudomonadota bacterium]